MSLWQLVSRIQHDSDSRPLLRRFEVRMLSLSLLVPDASLSLTLVEFSENYLSDLVSGENTAKFVATS